MKIKSLCLTAALGVLTLPAISASVKPNHLIITEVATSGGKYTNGSQSSEFTEIYNPTNAAIDLSNYYLTDWSRYWDYPYVFAWDNTNFPKEGGADWIVRFPAGTSIPAGGTVVVTAHGQYFLDAYFASDIDAFKNQAGSPQLFEHTNSRADVQDMIDLNLDSIADPNLKSQSHTDGGENIFLFYWNGQSDLVYDVDIVMYATAGTDLGNDNGYLPKGPFTPTDGPDPGSDLSAYQNDNGNANNLAVRNGSGSTTRQLYRRSIYEIGEITTGGNGLTGHDETSEQSNISWVVSLNSAEATPGVLPASVLAADQPPIIWATRDTASPSSGSPVTIRAQIMDDGTITSAKVYWSKAGATTTSTITMTNTGGDNWTANIPAQADRTGIYWYVEATDNTGNTRTEKDYNYVGSKWIAHYYYVLDQALYDQDIMITEIYFDNEGSDNIKYSEFIELFNARNVPLDLSHAQFYYNSNTPFEFPAGSILEAKGRLIIACEGRTFKYHDYPRYDATPVVDLDLDGVSYFGNTAGTFNLIGPNELQAPGFAPTATPFESVSYDIRPESGLGWPSDAAGTVYTFELKNYDGTSIDNNDGNNWAKAVQEGGSPGKRNSVENTAPVVITGGQRDVQYPGYGVPITITCQSATANAVTLYYKTNTQSTYQTKPMTKSGTSFSAQVGPFSTYTRVKYYMQGTDSAGNIGFQPYAFPFGFVVDDSPAGGADVVINEIMYNPRGTDNYSGVEYVELYNTTNEPIDLSWWELGRAPGDYYTRIMPEGTVIGPHDFIAGTARTWLMEREYPGIDASKLVDWQWWDSRRDDANGAQISNSVFANSGTASDAVLIHANARGWGNTDSFHLSGTPVSVPTDIAPYEVGQNGWPTSTDGYSIELINPTMDNSIGSSWLQSAAKYGSPLQQNGVTSAVNDWSVY